MLIDTHAHLNFKAYKDDLEQVIKRTLAENIRVINVGTKYETSRMALEIAEKHEGMYASIGMHPIHIKTDLLKIKTDKEEGAFQPLGEEFDKEKYRQLANPPAGGKKVVAIGEIGLDYYYKPKTKKRIELFKNQQKEVFIKQLELAKELGLPVIVHCRMAHEEMIDVLKPRSPIRGVIHCFTGNWEQAKRYMEMGFYLGFNGIIFSAPGGPASGWKLELEETIRRCPLDKILVETDCPYLTPLPAFAEASAGKPENGKRNEPVFIKYVVQRIAELKSLSYEEISGETCKNSGDLFGI